MYVIFSWVLVTGVKLEGGGGGGGGTGRLALDGWFLWTWHRGIIGICHVGILANQSHKIRIQTKIRTFQGLSQDSISLTGYSPNIDSSIQVIQFQFRIYISTLVSQRRLSFSRMCQWFLFEKSLCSLLHGNLKPIFPCQKWLNQSPICRSCFPFFPYMLILDCFQ